MARSRATPRVGLAYNTYVPAFVRDHERLIDYVEVPFELLRHDNSVLSILDVKPIILHCASMSIAGTTRPPPATAATIAEWCQKTRTPWLGEHLSFIVADRGEAGAIAEEYAPGEPYNIGYTVSPPMNAASVAQVLSSLRECRANVPVPIILENPPVYFDSPGSVMTQTEFINEICRQDDVNLLLDLAHLHISSKTQKFDACSELESLPLNRVIEVHISGVEEQAGVTWDNHASRAPAEVFEMLERVVKEACVEAITLEYNWSSRFPREILVEELEQARRIARHATTVTG